MSLLEIRGLQAGYGQIKVLFGIDLAIAEGEFLGVLGHNGMGKTTLLRAIAGHLPAAGTIRFAGTDITRLPAHRRARAGLAYVPQGREIFPQLSVRENMLAGALGAGQGAGIVAETLLAFPRLVPLAERAGGVLSGGEQQLLALARCLCGKPRLLLLDEPTEGVQPSIRDEIIDTLQALRRRMNLTILLVEQNVRFLESLSQRVLYMEKGTLHPAARADFAVEAGSF